MRTFTNHSQLVSFYDYAEGTKILKITLKDGNRYNVEGFGKEAYSALSKAANKGSHIYHHVFKNPAYEIYKAGKMSPKKVQEIVQAQYNKKNQVFRFASEGWSNHLAR